MIIIPVIKGKPAHWRNIGGRYVIALTILALTSLASTRSGSTEIALRLNAQLKGGSSDGRARDFLFDLVHSRGSPGYCASVAARRAPSTPMTIPVACFVDPAMHLHKDMACYLNMTTQFEKESAEDPLAPYCFGPSGRPAGSAPLLFHTGEHGHLIFGACTNFNLLFITHGMPPHCKLRSFVRSICIDDAPTPYIPSPPPAVSMDGVHRSIQLLVSSFVATQCDDAVLWIWLTSTARTAMEGNRTTPSVPSGLAHRVVFKELDVAAEWALIRSDFPDVNATAAAHMTSFLDIRHQANWARLLITYAYGGIYVDMDTAFLRDWRPLFDIPAFSYREGPGIGLNIAVLRLNARPNAASRDLIARAAQRHESGQAPLSRILALWDGQSRWFGTLQYMSLPLFDAVWLRFNAYQMRHFGVAAQHIAAIPQLRKVHPEFTYEQHWNAFFDAASPASAYSRSVTPFFAGSFSYHWHNRYSLGLPPTAWAGILADRFRRLALLKEECSGGDGTTAATATAAATAAAPAEISPGVGDAER